MPPGYKKNPGLSGVMQDSPFFIQEFAMNRLYALITILLACSVLFACTRQQYTQQDAQQDTPQNVQQDIEAVFRYYFTDDKEAIILERFLGQGASVTIPSTIQNLPVVKIGRRAFYGIDRETRLVNVIIPDTVMIIERDAFSHNRLEELTIGNSVAFIGREAFIQNRLTSVNIPDTVYVIDSMSFMQNRLVNITIPGSVIFIGSGAFMQNRLADAVISDGTVYIGRLAFAINQLTSVNIPDSVTRIWPFAFENNPITQISIGANVELGESNLAGHFFPSFDHGFDEFYFAHGRRAGTYTFNNGAWSVEFR